MPPKVALCAIARSEEVYLTEWIEYHLAMGFEHLFIHDNNNPGNDSVPELCSGKPWEHRVSVIDYRGKQAAQLQAYNECYTSFGADFDWFAFLDADEFLTFGPLCPAKSIGEFLSEASGFDTILVNWLYFGDNGKARQEPGSLIDRFPKGLPHSPENRHVKSIVRCGLPLRFVRNPHVMDGPARIGDDSLRPVPGSPAPAPFKTPSFDRLYIRHYGTKTVEEYIRYKIRRGAADQLTNPYRLDLFYRTNERTREKKAVEKSYFRFIRPKTGTPPTVSVIVPCYNHGKYIRQRIESILGQTFSDYELILLDDCSPDNCPAILFEYRNHPAVSCIVLNTRNGGSPFRQWEKGIRLARGRYVWIAESDDSADPDFLKATVEQLERHPEARLCITGSHVIDHENNPVRLQTEFDPWPEDGKAVVLPAAEYLRSRMLKINSVYNASMVLFRRKGCLDNICPEFYRMHYCGDWLFWIEQIRKGPIIEIHRKLNFFRKHNANTTRLGTDEGHSFAEIAFVRNWLCKEVFRDWKTDLEDKYDLYQIIRSYPVSSRKRRRRLMREAARSGKVTWWRYRLWKLFCSYRKHFCRKA